MFKKGLTLAMALVFIIFINLMATFLLMMYDLIKDIRLSLFISIILLAILLILVTIGRDDVILIKGSE